MGNIFSISLSLDGLASGCWNCITAQANLVCKLQKNCSALEIERENLMVQKNDVERRIRLDEEQQMEALEEVKTWISRVEKAIVDIDQVIANSKQEIEKLCLGGCCSKSLKSSYKFGKEVAEKLEYVASLKNEGVFKEVAAKMPLAPLLPRPTEDTVGMESTFDKVWSCLGQEDVGIIGLYGLGGVGKTTLLTKINNHFPSDSGFVIIWVVVSKDLNLQKIQDGIWKRLRSLDDSWERKSHDNKAVEIYTVLREKKFVLLLDDIWEQVDLKEVGVPLPNKANRSKIVFTTRSKDVCGLMDATKKIEVKCLSPEKAWELFQEKVGADTLSSHPDIPKLAESVAKECDGLPLALITIGRAMACKNTPQQWKRALGILKSSASKFTGMTEKVFARLKFTFDNLQNDAHRSCFLYCALYPEDFHIFKDELLNYWIGEGYLGEYNEIEEARNEAYEIIGTLLNACLLEEVNNPYGGYVKMHDMVRDMALWIVSENEKKKNDYFLVQAGAGLTKAPEIKKWAGAKKISLMNNNIGELTETTLCLNLTTLFLCGNNLTEIPDGFFDYMSNLRVLNLSNNEGMSEVPLGISKLVSLQYLNLSHTGITQLPIELRSLVNLKCLDLILRGNHEMIIPRWLISSFLKLQVCTILCCSASPLDVEDNVLSRGNEDLLEELEGLEHLQCLGIIIHSESALQRYFRSNKLQSCTRELLLCNIQSLTVLNISCLQNVKHLDTLYIFNVKNVEELEIDWMRGGRGEIEATNNPLISTIRSKRLFLSLLHVEVSQCTELRDVTWLVFAPNIKTLSLNCCNEMEEVINVEKLGGSPEDAANLNPFSQLKILGLYCLPRLKSIYPSVLPFPHLIRISVVDCLYLKRLPLNSNSAERRKIAIKGQQLWWDELEWEDEAHRNALHFLPTFD